MDTLTAYLSHTAHITRSLERERVTQAATSWRESFAHPAHKTMLLAHESRVNEFYNKTPRGNRPATDAQLAELLSESNLYKSPIPYKPRKTKRNVITADRLLQIAVEAAERKQAS